MHNRVLKVYENDDTLVLILVSTDGDILGYDFIPHSSQDFNSCIEHIFHTDPTLVQAIQKQGLKITEDKFTEILHEHAVKIRVYRSDFIITEALKKYLEK